MIVHGYDLGPLEPLPDGWVNPGGWSAFAMVSLEEVTAQQLYDAGGRYFGNLVDEGILEDKPIDNLPAKSMFDVFYCPALAKPDCLPSLKPPFS